MSAGETEFFITQYDIQGDTTLVFPTEPVARTMDVPAFPGMKIGPTFGGILRGVIGSLETHVEIAGGADVVDNRTDEPVRRGRIEIPAGYSARTLTGGSLNEIKGIVSTAVDRATSLRARVGKQPAVIRRGV